MKKVKKGFYTLPTDPKLCLKGQKWSCLHDAVIIAARALEVSPTLINKHRLYKQCKPRKGIGTNLAQIMAAPCVKETLAFENENYANCKGGVEFALLQVQDDKHRIVGATVFAKSKNGRAITFNHAFYLDPSGKIVDNKLAPSDDDGFKTGQIEAHDRATVGNARAVFSSFFGWPTRINSVHTVHCL